MCELWAEADTGNGLRATVPLKIWLAKSDESQCDGKGDTMRDRLVRTSIVTTKRLPTGSRAFYPGTTTSRIRILLRSKPG